MVASASYEAETTKPIKNRFNHDLNNCPLKLFGQLTLDGDWKISYANQKFKDLLVIDESITVEGLDARKIVHITDRYKFDDKLIIEVLLYNCRRKIKLQSCWHKPNRSTTLWFLKKFEIPTKFNPHSITHLTNYNKCSTLILSKFGVIVDGQFNDDLLINSDCLGQPIFRYIDNKDLRLLFQVINPNINYTPIVRRRIKLRWTKLNLQNNNNHSNDKTIRWVELIRLEDILIDEDYNYQFRFKLLDPNQHPTPSPTTELNLLHTDSNTLLARLLPTVQRITQTEFDIQLNNPNMNLKVQDFKLKLQQLVQDLQLLKVSLKFSLNLLSKFQNILMFWIPALLANFLNDKSKFETFKFNLICIFFKVLGWLKDFSAKLLLEFLRVEEEKLLMKN